MKFLRTTLLALSLVLFAAQPVAALVISDGSSGVFRPISDFTLDLSGLTVPQYSSIYIDAGIKLTILTPTGGAFGDLLAANDIFVNGIIDAGSGSLGLLAGNQIMLGAGSQVFGGSLNIVAPTIMLSGVLSLPGGHISVIGGDGDLKSPPVFDRPGAGLISGDVTILPGVDLTLRADPPNTRGNPADGGNLILMPGQGGLQGGLTNLGAGSGSGVTLSAVPEPSTILLLLPGLILLARGAWRKAAP